VTVSEPRVCTTTDGLHLEAEYAPAAGGRPRVAAVLCHPHPQFGGSMRSIVTSALFESLPEQGVSCLRFNFRGVEGSEGLHGGGSDEPLDVVAALDVLAAEVHPSVPIALAGWSFGGDMALSVDDARLAGWVAIAPPLRFTAPANAVAHDPRPKLLLLAQHDEFRPPAEIEADVRSWANTRTEVIAGASHFFVGRTDRVVAATAEFLAKLVASS
jgi:alpha/beta superfamily hydrolase